MRCHSSPSSPPPRSPAQAKTPPALTQARTWGRYRGDMIWPKPPYPVSRAGRGTSGLPVGEITNIRTVVPSREEETCRVTAPSASGACRAPCSQRVARHVRPSKRRMRVGVTKSV